jgi:ferritin
MEGGRGMSRYLIGMSGDKDKMIAHLEKCEKQMVKRFAEIKEIVMQDEIDDHRIIEICDLYVDKRSEEEKMFDSLNESLSVLEQRMIELQSVVRAIKEGDE